LSFAEEENSRAPSHMPKISFKSQKEASSKDKKRWFGRVQAYRANPKRVPQKP
jgi:hypothetical protein